VTAAQQRLLMMMNTCMYDLAQGTLWHSFLTDIFVMVFRTFSVESTTESSGNGGMLHAGVLSQSLGI
jgi:hypothetical protein